MIEYRIKEEDKKTILKKYLFRILPFSIIAIIAGFGISFYQIGNVKLFITIIFPALILTGIAVLIGLKIGFKIYKESHIDIIFRIDNNIFTILKNGKEFITFDKDKINKIEQYKNKSLIIFLTDKNEIMLNDNIENYDNLINEIKDIHPITYIENKKSNKFNKFYALIMIALMVMFYIGTNRIIIIITGVIISIILLYAFIKIFFNKYTDKKIKLCIIMVLLVIYDIIKKILEII
jgi:hypothetical protein